MLECPDTLRQGFRLVSQEIFADPSAWNCEPTLPRPLMRTLDGMLSVAPNDSPFSICSSKYLPEHAAKLRSPVIRLLFNVTALTPAEQADVMAVCTAAVSGVDRSPCSTGTGRF